MEVLLALAVGWLYASGLYLMLRRSIVKLIIGLALLTNATNLLIFTSAGLVRGNIPIVPAGEEVLGSRSADPLPQALVLTAIVIGFGLQAFAMALAYRVYRELRTEDPDRMRRSEQLRPGGQRWTP